MRPIKLKIKGINSFTDEQIIDFEKLSKEGLFGIVGDTGSGKSSILDAITIALYGSLSKNTAEFVNKEIDKAMVVFDFAIEDGNGEKQFRVERGFRRNASNEKYPTLTRLYENLENPNVIAEGVKEVSKKIQDILGLSFEDFTRTVVLPQGKFSEFLLQIKGADRRKMLERIFNLERYGSELFVKVRDEKNKSYDKLKEAKAKIEVYGDISDEVCKTKEDELKRSEKELTKISTKLDVLKKEVQEAQRVYELQQEINKINETINRLECERQRIYSFGNKNNIPADRLTAEGLRELNNNLKQADKLIDSVKKEVELKNTSAVNFKKYTDFIEKETINKNTIEKRLAEAIAEIVKISDRLEDAKSVSKEFGDKVLRSERELSKCREPLINVENEYKSLCEIKKRADEIEKEIKLSQHRLIALGERVANGETILEENKVQLAKVEEQLEVLKDKNIAIVLAKNLKEGQPCPVCGSTSHPHLADTIQTELIKAYEKEISDRKKNDEKYDTLLKKLKGDVGIEEGIIKSKTDDYKKYKNELESKSIEKLSKCLGELRAKFDNAKNQNALIIQQSQKAVLLCDELEKSHNRLLKEKETLDKDFTNAEKNILKADTEIKLCNADIERFTLSIDEKQKEINTLMTGFADKSIKLLIKESSELIDFIDNYARQKNLADDNLSKLTSQLEGRTITKHELEELKNGLLEIEELKENLIKGIAVGKDEINKMKDNIIVVKELMKEIKSYQHRCDMLNELSKLIEGNKFVEYIAENQLKYIAQDASERLKKISGGRYALEILDGEFIMRDDSCGGMKRRPNTLSGGEVFLTSFALALSLSNKIQMKSSAPLRFFFLDEGFGTLDRRTLEIVMGALDELRGRGMTIGVITHVDEVKDRLPIKLSVMGAVPGEHGSKVTMVC